MRSGAEHEAARAAEQLSWEAFPLFAAVRLVAAAQGMEIVPPGGSRQVRDPLSGILNTNHLRARRVLLSDGWWRQESGPLLGFRDGTREPVALVPARLPWFARPRYLLHDGSTIARTVDGKLAETLEPAAWMVYPPLPLEARPASLLRTAVRGRQRDILVILLTAIATTVLAMLTPQATLLLVEYAIPNADRTLLGQLAFGLLAAGASALLFDLARGFSMLRLETFCTMYLQPGLMDRLLGQSPAFFRGFSSGDLGARVQTFFQLRHVLNANTLSALFMSLIAPLNVLLLFYYSPALAAVGLALGLIAAAASGMAAYFMARLLDPLQQLEGDLFGLLVQLIGAAPKLRVAGAERRAFAQWGLAYARKQGLRMELQAISDKMRLLAILLLPLSTAIILATSRSRLMGDSTLSPGAFLAFSAAFGTFLAGSAAVGEATATALTAKSLWMRMAPILEARPEADAQKADPGQLRGDIRIDQATFRYRQDGPPTLDAVSIRADAGECIAIVGPSGCGKSTLVNLLLGFEIPASGTVSFDGRDLRELDVHEVRRQLGVVTQDNKIMAGTIYDNIACGSLASLEDVMEAARAAGFAEDIEQMPMGLHTLTSEMGANISGGQRQRLLIARALLSRPRILILDEATSALDNRTQDIVTRSLDRLHVTRVIIAHRFSTIRNADRIYVLAAGRVVQHGRFEELMEDSNGLFARLMRRQMV